VAAFEQLGADGVTEEPARPRYEDIHAPILFLTRLG
jgi:hypothetical protein